MQIIESILTENRCFKAGKKITPKGLMLHSVGCSQPSAQVFLKTWNNAEINACVHGFIDGNTGIIYETLPWNHRGWHCASGPKGSGNNTHIGVEMCEPACIKYTGGATFTCSDPITAKRVAVTTYESAVELFAKLAWKFDLDPLADGVIISHAEGFKRGIASNHGDPEHLWKQLGMDYTLDTFRNAVYDTMKAGNMITPPSTEHGHISEGNAQFQPYLVRVTISDLYIRSGPGTDTDKRGFIKPGVYTIVQESPGKGATLWGKLKSGAGWISLDYAKRV